MYCLPFIYGINSDPARNKRYPFCSSYYWDEKSNIIYAIAYFTQVITGLIMGISYSLGMDSFCCTAIYHTCAQLNILQTQLLKVGTKSNISKALVKNLVLKHKFQINKLCLIQLLTSCITVCFTGFQLIIIVSRSHVDLNGAFFYAGFLLANLFQVLLYCWPSDELMDQVNDKKFC
ncbi:putative odorant receptor 98b isoform X2 [Leptopilina boulardi]|uniref:putative odorant receptor 98b isoform X2 n=1 Tax=Leptopilina boulardi TaxID=63433 RepID=UPI0021F59AA1|nr:putative odorant receptor 98b isoform X2 [Leptopilina boulardi]